MHPVLPLLIAASATAQSPELLKRIARAPSYEEFSLGIKEVSHRSRRFFELYGETPPPADADLDVSQSYRLFVRGNAARMETWVGGPGGTLYTAVFDGEKTLDFRLLKTLPNGGTVLDATEERRNGLAWGAWHAFGRDDATLRPWWQIPRAIRSAVQKNGEIVVRWNAPGVSLIRLGAKPPYAYRGETYVNKAGKAGHEIVVTKRFSDGFPKEIRTTTTILGERVAWTTHTVAERKPGPLDPALFRVVPAPGSRIVDNAADAIYRIGPDGERTKIGRVSGGGRGSDEDAAVLGGLSIASGTARGRRVVPEPPFQAHPAPFGLDGSGTEPPLWVYSEPCLSFPLRRSSPAPRSPGRTPTTPPTAPRSSPRPS